MSAASSSGQTQAQALLEQQQELIDRKFAQIKALRRQAHATRLDAEQKQRNQETDQQILLLMQTDERLASLLSEAAASMRALLPGAVEDQISGVTQGAKIFEAKAQQWFAALNEVQYSLRSAVRQLRDSQLAPLTTPCGPEARLSGLAGSAGQGQSVSLLETFVDLSSTDDGPQGKTALTLNPLSTLPETRLSLQALREHDRNWKELSRSLQELVQTYPTSAVQSDHITLANALTDGTDSSKLLLEALFNLKSRHQ